MKPIDKTRNPWAGLSSYEDPAKSSRKLKFCGRDEATYDVTQLIDDNFLVTLYGKSGIGKTSLLNAGVFPALRREQYTPLSLRLGITEESDCFQDIITDAVERAVGEAGGGMDILPVVDEQPDREAVDYLWNYFARRLFTDAEGRTTFPVIVFDQFEEVFRRTESRLKAETLLKQIHYLIDESHALNDCIIEGMPYYYDFNFRFVISIREDDLYRLEDSIDNCALTALKRCRYRLRSLSEQGARDAILIPGEGLFLPEEQDGIVKAIVDKSRNEDGSISTNIVSLLCNRIFADFQKSNATHISQSLVDDFIKGNPFERFYNEATRGFSNRERSYIEDHLVDSTGRRNSIPESDFLLHVPNGARLLEGDNRILQRISTSADGGNYRVELIHDSFCEPLAGLKEKRARRRRMQWIASSAAIALLCMGVVGYILYQTSRIRSQAGTIAQKEEDIQKRNQELEAKNKQLLLQQDSLLAVQQALNQNNKELDEKNQQLRREQENLRLAQKEISEKNQRLESTICELDESNKMLQNERANLNNALAKLEEERANLKESNRAILENRNRFIAEKGQALINDHDTYTARLLALNILPSEDNPETPYTIEAEKLLRNAMGRDDAVLRNEKPVYYVAFSPDGKYIVSADNGFIRIWDAKTGGQVGKPFGGKLGIVNTVAFSPDGRYIVSASGKKVSIWDAKTGEQVGKPLERHTGEVRYANFSPDGRYIVSASADSTVRIWDAKTGEQMGKPLEGHTREVWYANFSPDGRYIVSASWDKTVRIWDAKTGEQVSKPLEGHTNYINTATFSPDGKYIVSAARDSTLRLWDVNTRKEIRKLRHTGLVNSAVFSPDGKYIVSSSMDETIRIWDAKTGTQVGKPLEGHTGYARSANFSPDGKYIVSSSPEDKTVRIWDIRYIETASFDKTKKVWNFSKNEPLQLKMNWLQDDVSSVFFNPDGRIVSLDKNENVSRIWDAKMASQMEKPLEINGRIVDTSPDWKYMVSVVDTTIWILDAKTGGQVGNPLKGHTDYVYSAKFSPDGQYIVSASADSTVRIWDAKTGKQVGKPLMGLTGEIKTYTTNFSPDGRYIVSTSWYMPIKIWDAKTGELVELPNMEGKIERVSPDMKYILVDTGFFYILCDIKTGESIISCWHDLGNNIFKFSPDCKYMINIWDYETEIWDVKTGKLVVPKFRSDHAHFSPDGEYVLSASSDGIINLWELKTGKQVNIHYETKIGKITNVVYSPDGKYIVVYGNNTIDILEAKTGKQVVNTLELTNEVRKVTFSPNGRHVRVEDEKEIKIYDFPPLQELIDETRKRFKNRHLTPEERKKNYLD